MQKQQPPEIVPASALRAHVEQLDSQRLAERQHTKAMFLEPPERAVEAPGDDEALDERERALISRGLELALLGRRLERHQTALRSPKLSRRKRRELQRAERRVAEKMERIQRAQERQQQSA